MAKKKTKKNAVEEDQAKNKKKDWKKRLLRLLSMAIFKISKK